MNDPMVPFMPTGNDQPFRDWLDFVERVARPIVEADGDTAVDEQMALYRLASPYFICACLVVAANERERLRAVVEAAKAVRHDPQCARLEHRAGCTCGWRTLRIKLDQLDRSGEAT